MKTKFPCDLEELYQFYELSTKIYEQETTPLALRINWFKQNRYSLICLMKDGTPYGFINLIPLTAKFENEFRKGIMCEGDIDKGSMLEHSELKHCKRLYIESIIFASENRKMSIKFKDGLIMALLLYIRKFICYKDELVISAETATKFGENLLKRYGFRKFRGKRKRPKCNKDYYSLCCSKEKLNSEIKSLKHSTEFIDYSALSLI